MYINKRKRTKGGGTFAPKEHQQGIVEFKF